MTTYQFPLNLPCRVQRLMEAKRVGVTLTASDLALLPEIMESVINDRGYRVTDLVWYDWLLDRTRGCARVIAHPDDRDGSRLRAFRRMLSLELWPLTGHETLAVRLVADTACAPHLLKRIA